MDQNCQNTNYWQKERSQQKNFFLYNIYLTQKILLSIDWLRIYKQNLGIFFWGGSNSYDVIHTYLNINVCLYMYIYAIYKIYILHINVNFLEQMPL